MNVEQFVRLVGNILFGVLGLYFIAAMEAALCGGTPLSNLLDLVGIGWR